MNFDEGTLWAAAGWHKVPQWRDDRIPRGQLLHRAALHPPAPAMPPPGAPGAAVLQLANPNVPRLLAANRQMLGEQFYAPSTTPTECMRTSSLRANTPLRAWVSTAASSNRRSLVAARP